MERIQSKWGRWTTQFDTRDLLGEVVAFDARNVLVPVERARQSLADAGLDPKLCRDICKPSALRRAVSKLRKSKIVGEVEDTPERLVFQFSKAQRYTATVLPQWATNEGGSEVLNYQGEGRVLLNKETGDLDGDNRELVQQVATLLDEALVTRKTTDITSIANRIFRKHGDLFPIKQAGGAYFVPARHAGVVDAVQKFLKGVGVELARYPIAKGKLTGETTVRDAIKEGLEAMLADHRKAVEGFSEATRKGTMNKQMEAIQLTKFKIDAYVEYLGDETQALREKAWEMEKLWADTVTQFMNQEEHQEAGELVEVTG